MILHISRSTSGTAEHESIGLLNHPVFDDTESVCEIAETTSKHKLKSSLPCFLPITNLPRPRKICVFNRGFILLAMPFAFAKLIATGSIAFCLSALFS